MPVEIRELHITTVVEQNSGQPVQTPVQSGSSASNMDEIIASCVEQVLEILKQKTER